MIQSWIALYDQVEPAPATGTGVAAKAGWAGTSRPAHKAVSLAPATDGSLTRAPRPRVMPEPYAGRLGPLLSRAVSGPLTFGVEPHAGQ